MSRAANTGDTIIDIHGLEVEYRRDGRVTNAVQGVNLQVRRGERVAIVGESGSGKTTIANALLGLLPRAAKIVGGSAKINGVELAGAKERVARGLRGRVVGLVPQDPTVSLNPTLRIGFQVAEAVRRRGVRGKLVDVEVVEALTQAGIDDPVARARQYPHELSGGLRQRVLIAIALAGHPEIIVADEPTSALDVTVQRRILDHLDRLVRERGIALVIITHDLGVAADRADRIVVLKDGVIVEEGETVGVLRNPRSDYTVRLVSAAPGLSAEVEPRQQLPEARVITRWEGVSKEFLLPRGAAERTLTAVDEVSLEVKAGQTLAVVGESGSGKTTLLRIALGLEQPTRGRVTFEGEDLATIPRHTARQLRRRFQLVQQNPWASLDPKFSVRRSIAEPLVSFGIGDARSRKLRVDELLDLVALPHALGERKPDELSGGQRQRVAIARALALEPELIYLDEPVSALDVSVQDQVLRLLARLQEELGVAYVFVSHDLSVVAQMAHAVAVLRHGRLVEHGSADDVLHRPQHEYTRDLLAAVPGRAIRKVVVEWSSGLI